MVDSSSIALLDNWRFIGLVAHEALTARGLRLVGGQIEMIVSGLPSFVDAVLNEYLDGDSSVLRRRLLSLDACEIMIHVVCLCVQIKISFFVFCF